MRICIPTETDLGLEAIVYGHFGSAPYFTIYDTDKNDCEIIDNSKQHHSHGTCHPLTSLEGKDIDAVVCQGMGKRAVQKLNDAGISAYKAESTKVREILEKYLLNGVEAMTSDNACHQHHECH